MMLNILEEKMISKVISAIIIAVVRIYQYTISPLLGKNCRFLPTCSEYAIEVIKSHGPFKGSYLAFKRILKCHPFHEGGIDKPPK